MFSLSTVLYLTAVILPVATAKPLNKRQTPPRTCTPGFTGDDPYDWNNSEPIGLSDGVGRGSRLIKVKDADRGLFQFTRFDSSPPSFTIQPFENLKLAVGLEPNNNSLHLIESKDKDNTRFVIECGDCGSFVEDNCFMKLADKPDLCVQVGSRQSTSGPTRGAIGDPLFLVSPCRRDDSQRFNFFKRVAPTKSTTPTPSSTTSTLTKPQDHEHSTTTPVASPTPSICNPNFEFEGVRVANSAVSWGAPSFESNVDLIAESDFTKRLEIRFEQTGAPNPYYIAKSLNGTNLVVATRAVNDNLYFISGDEGNDRKFFKIECRSGCRGAGSVAPGELSADGCVIKSVFNGKCVQLGNGPSAGNAGDRIFLSTCDGTDSQRFNFITSPFKQSGRPASSLTSSSSGAAKVHLSGSPSDDTEAYLRKLVRNTNIGIGLLAASLLVIIVFCIGSLLQKGLKGRDSKPRYTVVPS